MTGWPFRPRPEDAPNDVPHPSLACATAENGIASPPRQTHRDRARPMPWSYTCDVEKDVIYITASGVIDVHDLTVGVAAIMADPRLRPTTRTLNDYRAATEIALTPEFIHSMGTLVKVQPIASRRAYLVKDGQQLKAVTSYMNSVGSEWLRAFTDRAELVAWLNEGQPQERWIE